MRIDKKKSGKLKDAIKSYKKSTKLMPDFQLSWYCKAAIYSLMKDKKNMISTLKKAIELFNKSKEKVKSDEDFKEYWNDPDFKKLTE